MKYTTRRRAEKLLKDFANCKLERCARFLKDHPEVVIYAPETYRMINGKPFLTVEAKFDELQQLLRSAWRELDSYKFKMLCFSFMTLCRSGRELGSVERAVFHFIDVHERLRYCENAECKTPHYFKRKKNQKFCCKECAKPAQRASKRKWWGKNRARKEQQ